MATRRDVLRGAGVGTATALAGCQAVWGGSSSSDPEVSTSFVASPLDHRGMDGLESDPMGVTATCGAVDVDGLRDHRDRLAERYATVGFLSEIVPRGSEDAFDIVLRTVSAAYRINFEGTRGGAAMAGYASGDVDPESYRSTVEAVSPLDQHGDYEIYAGRLDRAVGVRDGALVSAVSLDDAMVAGTIGSFVRTLLQGAIDRSESGREPSEWVTDVFERVDDAHVSSLHLRTRHGSTPPLARAQGYFVDGGETELRVSMGFQSADEFQRQWADATPADWLQTGSETPRGETIVVEESDASVVLSTVVPTGETRLAADG